MSGIPASIEAGGYAIVVGNGRNGPTGGAGPIERIAIAQPVLPCPGCAHAAVCSIRPELAAAPLALRAPASPNPAIRIRLTVDVECSHFLAARVTTDQTTPVTPERETWAAGQARRGATLGESRRRGSAGLVRARAVKAEIRQAAGGGSGEATEPGWPGSHARAARADRGGDQGELRPTPRLGWVH